MVTDAGACRCTNRLTPHTGPTTPATVFTAEEHPMQSTATIERPVSVALAAFQSIGDPAMQCVHGASLFGACHNC